MTPPGRRPALRRPVLSRPALRGARRRLLIGGDRALRGFVNALQWWGRDGASVVDQAPYDVVHRDGKLQVRRYVSLDGEEDWPMGRSTIPYRPPRQSVPVLLVPPLMVRPFIYDLSPDRSYVRTLLAAGFDVFVVDFGEPDHSDRHLTLDHYVTSWMPQAIEAACNSSGSDGVAVVGYCMGGLFALMCAATRETERVRAIVTIGAPIDSHKMALVSFFVRRTHDQIDIVSRHIGNVPGALSSRFFRLVSPMKRFTRYGDLFLNLWNDEYVDGFDALTQWTENFVDFPRDAFRQLMRDFMHGNQLRAGTMEIAGEAVDLGRITCPVLAFAGRGDQIVPPSAARELLDLIGSVEKAFVEVPGGHMGVFAGRHAPDMVWQRSAVWLAAQTGGSAVR